VQKCSDQYDVESDTSLKKPPAVATITLNTLKCRSKENKMRQSTLSLVQFLLNFVLLLPFALLKPPFSERSRRFKCMEKSILREITLHIRSFIKTYNIQWPMLSMTNEQNQATLVSQYSEYSVI
jgi:hypothetical protein